MQLDLNLGRFHRVAVHVVSMVGAFYALSVFAEPKVYKDEYLIEPVDNVAAARSAESLKSLGFSIVREIGNGGAKLIKPAALAASVAAGDEVIPYDPQKSLCPALLKRGLAKSCSPNFQVHISGTPNDPQLSSLWGMGENGVNARAAWDISTGSNDVVVAIIDTGVDYRHQDLASNIWTNSAEVPGNGLDDDHNGYVDDVHGINAATQSGNPMDDNDHGTHVAGTIGALGNNDLGVVGVNWRVKIMALKFLNKDGSGAISDAIKAIDYMVLMKQQRGVNIRVANNSWGGGGHSAALESAIGRARAAGIIFVAAAGNESNDNDSSPSYPASYELDNVVSVAAIDKDGNMASFSNYGALSVGIGAPGVDIVSTVPGNRYASYSGTSMATPHVSGSLALLLASEPSLGYADAIKRLYESGSDLPGLSGVTSSSRKANVARMLANQTLPLPPKVTPSVCQYGIDEIGYTPPYGADGAPIVIQADEGNYTEIALPFQFPFHGTPTSKIYVSPNGVVYLSHAPSAYDYRNDAAAPRNSIAALHSDLIAERDPQGVRVATAADHVVIYWRMKYFSLRSGGDAEARLILYADGRIEDYLAFQNQEVETAVQFASTVGVTGPTTASAVTYSYDSVTVRNHAAIRFTPYCNGSAVNNALVTSVKIFGVTKDGLRTQASPGKGLNITIGGSGQGPIVLRAYFNKRRCPLPRYTLLSDGSLVLSGMLPRVPSSVTRLSVSVAHARGNIRVRSLHPRNAATPGKLSNHELSRYCSRLMNSLTR
jgi:subtilisin family serine protease